MPTQRIDTRRWQDWSSLVLGIWLFVSPWVLQFAHAIGRGSIGFFVTGVAIAVLAILALNLRTLWSEWVTFVLGLWLIGSPWLLGFAADRPAGVDAVVAGGLVAIFAVWVILRDTPRPGATADAG